MTNSAVNIKIIHRKLLTYINGHIIEDSKGWQNFTEHLKAHVGKGLLAGKSLLDQLEVLSTHGYLKPGHYTILKQICYDSGNIDIIEMIELAEEKIEKEKKGNKLSDDITRDLVQSDNVPRHVNVLPARAGDSDEEMNVGEQVEVCKDTNVKTLPFDWIHHSSAADPETTQKRVRLVKTYALIKEEMELSTARSIGDRLLKYEPRMLTNNCHENFRSIKKRKDAVECLLKKVLLGPDDIYDALRNSLDPDDDERFLRKLDEEPVTESDIRTFMALERSAEDNVSIPTRKEPRLSFSKKNRRTLKLYLHDSATIDSINDNFLSRLFFRINEHTNIADTTLNAKTKLKYLLDTMEKCSEKIAKDFCEILESESVGMAHVVKFLDGKQFDVVTRKKGEKRKLNSAIDDDVQPTSTKCRQMNHYLSPKKQANTVRSLNQPGSNMRNTASFLGLAFEQAENGSIKIQFTQSNPDSWKILEMNCRKGNIKDFIPEVFKDNRSDMEEGEYWFSFTIYMLPVPTNSKESQKILFHLENEKSSFTEVNLEILRQELEVNSRLLSLLKKEGIVNDTKIRDIAKHPRREKVQRVLDEIDNHGDRGYTILKEFIRKENEYLYNEIVTSEGANGRLSDELSVVTHVTPKPARASMENRKQIYYQASVLLVVKKTDEKKGSENCNEDIEIICPTLINPVCHFPEKDSDHEYDSEEKYVSLQESWKTDACQTKQEEPHDGQEGKRKELADGAETSKGKKIAKTKLNVIIDAETTEETTGPIQFEDGLDGEKKKSVDEAKAATENQSSKTKLDVSIDTETINETTGLGNIQELKDKTASLSKDVNDDKRVSK